MSEQSKPLITEFNVFDKREVIHDCTVEIWENTVTGEVSIGWYRQQKGQENERNDCD